MYILIYLYIIYVHTNLFIYQVEIYNPNSGGPLTDLPQMFLTWFWDSKLNGVHKK